MQLSGDVYYLPQRPVNIMGTLSVLAPGLAEPALVCFRCDETLLSTLDEVHKFHLTKNRKFLAAKDQLTYPRQIPDGLPIDDMRLGFPKR